MTCHGLDLRVIAVVLDTLDRVVVVCDNGMAKLTWPGVAEWRLLLGVWGSLIAEGDSVRYKVPSPKTRSKIQSYSR